MSDSRFKLYASMMIVYVVWGSTYLANAIMVDGQPPLLMNGSRFVAAGTLLFGLAWLRGDALPTRQQWFNIAKVGSVMMGMSSGAMVFALKDVASGLVAIAAATIPLWAVIFACLWERLPTQREVFGLAIGFIGIIILNMGNHIWFNPVGGIALLFFPLAWSFGSIWSRHVDLPKGGMMKSSTLLLAGGIFMLILSPIIGESLDHRPSNEVLLAMLYLLIFGSMITFSAYNYVLHHASPITATSYAYVNPIIAVFLGWLLADEKMSLQIFGAGLLIILAVVIITTSRIPAGRITRLIRGERMTVAR